jgi:phosphoglycolate phosphatase-like HAD superfamily hydrolase
MLYDVTFDLDGVLADTYEANRHAYASVGVEFPRSAWGLPASAWLKDEELHRAKQEVYATYLEQHLQFLVTGPVVLRFLREVMHLKVAVVTNASFRSANQVMRLLDPGVTVDGLLCGSKIADLAYVRPRCHVDDQFVATGTSVVPYVDDVDLLLKGIQVYL